ncbi:MAG: methyl-accepting chemotaxis protein [Tepidibacter sp.]|jgi:methyl-accepting chemotaxis protein|uniref:methyl-accepting chemotaxis protein n=1 Tax=Tepidibacter sp. TaxID=2529387 RepID=UPI0025DB0E30|nr:methyl-accepting chemotaxis protein [Tepidibacter sp.]MCT4509991.1 methyl-accepting chemotaxis protein [Tepidibacter sp.]
MKNKIDFSGIKAKLTSAILIFMLIPIIAISFYVNIEFEKQLNEDFVKSTTKEIIQVDNAINMYFETVEENTNLLASNPLVKKADETITSYINLQGDSEGNIKMTPSQNGGIEQAIYNLYLNFKESHPKSSYVYMATKDGGYIQLPEGNIWEGYNPKERPYYKYAIENSGKTVRTAPYYFEADNSTNISTVRTIENDKGEVIGVQGLDVSLDGLTDILKNIKIGETGYIILVDKDGTIISHPKNNEMNFKNIKELEVERLNNIQDINSENFEIILNNKDYFVNIYTSPKTEWKFIAVVEKEELMQSANKIKKSISFIAIMFILIAFIISIIFSNKFSKPILVIVNQLNYIKDGNFTKKMPDNLLKRKDEFGNLSITIETMQEYLSNMVKQIKDSAKMVSDSSKSLVEMTDETSKATNEIATSIEQVATSSYEEAKDIEQGAVKLNELSNSIQSVSDRNIEMKSISNDTYGFSSKGLNVLKTLIEKSSNVNESVEEVNDIIKEMDGMSDQIGTITDAIKQIAEQTNLLALNAAIEAARAGESGKGFAVVAEEVRKLAEQSENSTGNIKRLIEKIQYQSKVAVERMAVTKNITKEQRSCVNETESIFKEILDSIKIVTEKAVEIQDYNEDMNGKRNELVDIISNISAVAEETAASSHQISAATEEQTATVQEIANYVQNLKTLSEELKNYSDKFEV